MVGFLGGGVDQPTTTFRWGATRQACKIIIVLVSEYNVFTLYSHNTIRERSGRWDKMARLENGHVQWDSG